jgi:hypothetical protein
LVGRSVAVEREREREREPGARNGLAKFQIYANAGRSVGRLAEGCEEIGRVWREKNLLGDAKGKRGFQTGFAPIFRIVGHPVESRWIPMHVEENGIKKRGARILNCCFSPSLSFSFSLSFYSFTLSTDFSFGCGAPQSGCYIPYSPCCPILPCPTVGMCDNAVCCCCMQKVLRHVTRRA